MRVALILGKNGKAVAERMSSLKDSLTLDSFDSITAYIQVCIKREIIYDRAVILLKNASKLEMTDLYTFWKGAGGETSLVFICREEERHKAETIIDKFAAINVGCMVDDKVSSKMMGDCIMKDTEEINEASGINSTFGMSTDDGEFTVEPEEQEELAEEVPVQEEVQSKPKKGLFGGLFGKKKQQEQPVMEQPQEVSQQEPEQYAEQYEEEQYSNEQYEEEYAEEPYSEEQYDNNSYEEEPYEEGYAEEYEPEPGEDETQYGEEPYMDAYDNGYVEDEVESDNKDEVDEGGWNTVYPEDENEVVENETSDNTEEYTYDEDFDTSIEATSYEDEGYSYAPRDDFNNSVEDDFNTTEVDDFDNEFNTQEDIEDDFVPQPTSYDEVEEDFTTQESFEEEEEDDFVPQPTSRRSMPTPIPVPTPKRVVQQAEEVDEDFTTDISNLEAGYQEEQNKPKIVEKVVEKVVEKEVIKTVGGSSIIKSLLSGKAHKIILFTGDRGTGVTTSAITLAQEFAKKIPVLYFDVDTIRHGLLSFIEYDDFLLYDEAQRDGIRRCKSNKAFENCICSFDDNLDILTSDYSSDVSDDDIILCQSIVAEMASNYGVVIIDCPIDNLRFLDDLVLVSNPVVCVNGTRAGVMNLITGMINSGLESKYRRSLVSRGVIFATHVKDKETLQDAISNADRIYDPSECNYLGMPIIPFKGKYGKEILMKILER